jgi:energy-coupling factor transporter ATP-binding protein EcfA2
MHDDTDTTDHLDELDELVESIGRWTRRCSPWPPARSLAADWAGAEPRIASLRHELARVLVVGVLGGTGTGKSTLVNALAGSDVSPAGDVARPTTKSPVVVAGPCIDCSWLPIERWGAKLVRSGSPAVAEIVLVDCPDPDTQPPDVPDAAAAPHADASRPSGVNRNRDLLEEVLPACDVLLVVSTAQKYRSWSVAREVLAFAPGRPVLFVQTHASRDVDIREDWRRELERQGFDVERIHRVDGVEAIRRAADGLAMEEGFADLVAAIGTELAGRSARRVRRTGAGDLVDWFFRRASASVEGVRQPVAEFARAIDRERTRLEEAVAAAVVRELRSSPRGWQRQVIAGIVESGTGGPFAAFLRTVAAIGSFVPRGREIGGVVGRLLTARMPSASGTIEANHAGPSSAASSASSPGPPVVAARETIGDVGLATAEIEQSRSILVGLAARAKLEEPLVGRARLPPERFAVVSSEVLLRVQRWLARGVDAIVASRRGRGLTVAVGIACEILFTGLLVAVLGRAGWSFFHDRLWEGLPSDTGGFLWESLFWVVVCGLLLRWIVVANERWGLARDVESLAERLPGAGCVDPVLEDFTDAAAEADAFLAEGDRLKGVASRLTAGLSDPPGGLGRLRRTVSGTLPS